MMSNNLATSSVPTGASVLLVPYARVTELFAIGFFFVRLAQRVFRIPHPNKWPEYI